MTNDSKKTDELLKKIIHHLQSEMDKVSIDAFSETMALCELLQDQLLQSEKL